MRFVVDDKIPFLKGVLEEKGVDVRYISAAKIAKEHLLDADGLIVRTRTNCNSALLDATNVKFIATATIGFDHIDTDYCSRNGIFWTNSPGCNSSSVAQYICSGILNWTSEQKIPPDSLTIGIVGIGNVGKKVAKIANTLGMKILLNDPPRERSEGGGDFVHLEKILHQADIISLHVPLQDEGPDKTFHLADEKFFCEIRKKALFINSSRGEVVDTAALKDALKRGKIVDAIIDVWENEPEIDGELLSLAKFATPHIAGYSTDGKANGTAMSVRAASGFFKLGLDDWFPRDILAPGNTEINLSGERAWDLVRDAVNFTYDIRRDDENLRNSQSEFEALRGAYPLRREFPTFSVTLKNKNAESILRKLEFQIKNK